MQSVRRPVPPAAGRARGGSAIENRDRLDHHPHGRVPHTSLRTDKAAEAGVVIDVHVIPSQI